MLHQLRSGDRPGRLVRPARPRREGRAEEGETSRSSPRSYRSRGDAQSPKRPGALWRRGRPRNERRTAMTSSEARPRHRPRHLRRLPRLRGRLQGMEHRRPPAALTDYAPYGAKPDGVWFNRVRHYEAGERGTLPGRTVNVPMSCLHCEEPTCVTVCPTGASYKRAEDGIVLVDRQVHRLQALRLGLPLRRARARRRRRRDEEVHALRRPHLQRDLPPEERVPACVLACPASARHFGDLGDPDSPSRSWWPSAKAST
jgi:ferredoxin